MITQTGVSLNITPHGRGAITRRVIADVWEDLGRTPMKRSCLLKRQNLHVHNDRVEGRDAALSRRVPSHDGLEGNGTGRHE